MRGALAVLAAFVCLSPSSPAHEVRPAYLELTQVGEERFDVAWRVPAAGENLRLGIYARFPDATVETRERTGRFVRDFYIESWSVQHPGGLFGETIHIDGLRSTLTDVLVRVQRLDGTTQVSRIMPSSPSLELEATPSRFALARTYLALGVEHILLGIDHLLFVLALLMLVKEKRRLIGTITAFTVAHSLSLVAATLGWVAVPGAPVEAVIALSIVFVASEIVHARRGQEGLTARAPWVVAFLFGLLHGFGFAGALHEVGLPDHAIPLALFLFNVGVEVGQLLFVAAVLLAVVAARRSFQRLPRWVELAPAYSIGAVAMFWTIERTVSFCS